MFRVVVYAEGQGERAGWGNGRKRVSGDALTEQELGTAHLLVRRCLERSRNLTTDSICFEEPLHSPRGAHANGSMLHSRRTLRPLLSWADERKKPHLAVVLVDADGKADRQDDLDAAIEGLHVDAVVAVAIQEFEAWLIADSAALKQVLHKSFASPRPPERMARREAKEMLQQWCEEHGRGRDTRELRRLLAESCDLDTLARQCPAFARFLGRLQPVRPAQSGG